MYMAVRQLEFALLLLLQQLDNISAAIQCVVLGKLPKQLVEPTTLQIILRNVTLNLPEGYELIFGTKTENIHLYYQIAKVSMIANAHYIKLIINVPLTTPAHHFVLYKIFTLPEKVSVDKFIQYAIDFPYLGLQTGQRAYTLLSKKDYSHCNNGEVTVCPAHTAVYSTRQLTCEFSLFFQTEPHHQQCERKLLLHYQLPTMQRHGTFWIYHFAVPQQVTLHCPEFKDSTPRTELLSGAGLLYDATKCQISTNDVHVFSELLRTTRTEFHAPQIYVPKQLPIMADHEIQQLEEIAPAVLRELDNISSHATTIRRTLDMDSLISMHYITQSQKTQLRWYSIFVASISALAILGLIYLCSAPYVHFLLCITAKPKDPVRTTSATNPDLQ
jgi:hypothetical protein